MGKAGAIYREMRFVIDDDLTHVYVAIEATGDAPIGVQGWHYKAFAPNKSVQDIIQLWDDGKEEPLLWPQGAPDAD